MRVIFSNAPWHELPSESKPGWRGVKAGSRWPHTFPFYGGDLSEGYVPFPFFLATAGALAKKNGFETFVRDSIALGESYEAFYQFCQGYSPDVVVLETTTPSLHNDLIIVERLKKRIPSVQIVFTGIHYELEEEEFLLSHDDVDFVIYGEYDQSINDLLLCLKKQETFELVPGLVYRAGNAVRKNPLNPVKTLAHLPWPERDDLPFDKYFDSVGGLQKPQLQVNASRGCPFGCIFCVWPQVIYRGCGYRLREPEDVVREIETQLAKYPYKSIYFDDDTFNVNGEHVLKIAKLMKERGLNRLPWSVMGRADLMTEEILIALKEAGIFSIKYGVESANQQILDEIDKSIDLAYVEKMIRFTKSLGIRTHLTFTFGLPSDTAETIEETIQFACKVPADFAQFSIATPFPGTKMYNIYEKNGWLLSKDWDLYNGSSSAAYRTAHLTGEQLESFVHEAYKRWEESRKVDWLDFKNSLEQKLQAEQLPTGASLLVLQSARYTWTQELIKLLQELHYDVHVLTHERFEKHFTELLSVQQIHTFNATQNFEVKLLGEYSRKLADSQQFAGAIVPYSNSDGQGYEEVEALAMRAGKKVLAGISLRREIIK